MKRIILLVIITILSINATQYRLTHIKKGGRLNVREAPVINSKTAIGTIPYYAVGIRIKECKYGQDGKEWCYISYPMGGEHLDGWVRRYFLTPMPKDNTSYIYIKNFLKNFYMADEENFLDKLKVFYHFPMQQYFYKKNVNLIQLRTKKVSFYKRWFRRKYRLIGFKILKRTDRYIDVQTTIRWNFKNRSSSESGKDIQKVRLIHEDNRFKVLAIKNLSHIVDPKEEIKEEILDGNVTNNRAYYIKVGSFFSKPNDEYLLKISNSGFTYSIEDIVQDGEKIKRVYIGPYSSEQEAMEKLEEVRAKINQNAYIQSF